MRRILGIGIAAALLAGILVATATATVEQTVEGVDDNPMTIPSGKIGDEVLYAWYWKMPQADAESNASVGAGTGSAGKTEAAGSAEAGSTKLESSPASLEFFRLERLGTSLDRQARLHDVVVIRGNYTSGDYSGTSVQHVELAKRSLVRSDYKHEGMVGSSLSWSSFFTPGLTQFFEHQGRTYELGQVVTHDASDGQCTASGLGIGAGSSSIGAGLGHRSFDLSFTEFDCGEEFSPKTIASRTWVAQRGTVDGYDAYDVRTESTLKLRDVEIVHDSETGTTVIPGAEYEMIVVRDQWVSAELPYVILDETVASRDGNEVSRSERVLQKYTAGSQDIQWGSEFTARPPALERARASPAPADGSGSKMPYKLSQAISDATGSLAPPQFRVWQQTHPASMLVAAQLMIGENSRSNQPSSMWTLVFAEPNGQAHEVAVERFQGVAQPLVTDRGDEQLPAFSPEIVPGDLVTLSEIEHAWTRLAPEEYAARGVNYVSWGFDVDPTEGTTCLGSSMASSESDQRQALRTVYLGWTTEGSCLEVPETLKAQVIVFQAESAEVLGLVEYVSDFDLRPEPGPVHRADVSTQGVSGDFRIARPDIAVATVTSSSLLAIFLAAYFLPALKVLGAEALLFVPGYAKLRKEAILDNRIRDQILETVKEDPGVSITDLSKKVEAGWGTIVYHLGVLEKNKMVSTVLDGRHRRVFPVGLVDFSGQGQLALLKNERVRALYELIHDQPGVFQEQLAKQIGISAPATYWHLKRLEDAGLVGRVRDGRRVHYYANDAPKAHDQVGMEVA